MLRRLAHLLGLDKKDDALEKRFARMRQLYGETPREEQTANVVSHMRTGISMRTVVGAQKSTGEQLRKNLLESYARIAESEDELVGSK